MSTIAQKMEVLAGYDRWREVVGTAPVDLSADAYGKHLLAEHAQVVIDEIEDIIASPDDTPTAMVNKISRVVQDYR